MTWLDIARAAAAGRFTFGMSSPVTSDSGLSALVGAATAVAGRGAALSDVGARQATSAAEDRRRLRALSL